MGEKIKETAQEAASEATQEEKQTTNEDTLYARIGGEAGVRQLVTLFSDNMEVSAEAKHVLSLHPADLTSSRLKLFQYFSGWFGGPPLYTDLYGHPRLRARHIHVPVTIADRDAWLKCLYLALETMSLPSDVHQDLLEKIVPMADHMRNVEEEPEAS
jgi:hemoglobin